MKKTDGKLSVIKKAERQLKRMEKEMKKLEEQTKKLKKEYNKIARENADVFIRNAEKQLKQDKKQTNKYKKEMRETKKAFNEIMAQQSEKMKLNLLKLKRRAYQKTYKESHQNYLFIYSVKLNVYVNQRLDHVRWTTYEAYHKITKNSNIEAIVENDRADCEKLYMSNEVVAGFFYKSHQKVSDYKFRMNYKPIEERTIKAILPYVFEHTHVDNLNIPEKDGECVQTGLMTMYKSKIPTLTIDKINDILNEGCNLLCKNKHEGHNFKHVMYFCQYYNISHYLLDIKNKLINKHVCNSSHYTPFIAYIIDNHIYLVTDPKTRQHITKVNADTNCGLLQNESIEKESKELRNKFGIKYEDIKEMKDAKVYLNEENLKELLKKMFIEDKKSKVNTLHDGKVTSIKLKEQNVVIMNNPNKPHGLGHKDIVKICDIFGIEFKNQSLSKLALEVFQMFNQRKPPNVRLNISKKLKKMILKEQENKCNNCDETLNKYEIDHVLPLYDGGDNSLENLQALCPECHESKTNKENIDRFFQFDSLKSSYNSKTKPIFTVAKNAFINGNGSDGYDEEHLGGLDINKCRRNILRYSQYNYCIFSSLDEPVDYNGENLAVGYYYVETTNYFPFKGNGWYSMPMIEYGLNENIIKRENIKYYLKPSNILPNDYFNKFIDHVLMKLAPHMSNPNIEIASKRIINSFVGCLGTKVSKSGTVTFTTSLEEASYNYVKYNDSVYKVDELPDGQKLYEIKNYKREVQNESSVPIFNQILDLEAIELHKSYKLVKQIPQTELVYLNTDQVVFYFENPKEKVKLNDIIKSSFWAEGIPKYKLESKIKHCNEIIKTPSTETYQLSKKEWNIINDIGTNDFEGWVKELLDTYKSFNVDGRAGTGKSHLINQIRAELKKRNINYQALAPTNKASNIIEGMTLHKFFSKVKNGNKKSGVNKLMHSIKYILVDEISMVKEVFYRLFYYISENYPSINWIVSGDFKQLPPVLDIGDYDYENSTILKEICKYNKVTLTKCRRADNLFFEECKNPNNIDKATYGKKKSFLNICYHNQLRKQINEECMKNWIKQYNVKNYSKVDKYEKNKQGQDMYIYKNLPLIGSIANAGLGIVNCESYYVSEYGQTISTIKETNGEHTMQIKNVEIPKYFTVGYCMTAHKAQGATFDKPFTIYQWELMDETMKYVALSRAKSKSLVNIM